MELMRSVGRDPALYCHQHPLSNSHNCYHNQRKNELNPSSVMIKKQINKNKIKYSS